MNGVATPPVGPVKFAELMVRPVLVLNPVKPPAGAMPAKSMSVVDPTAVRKSALFEKTVFAARQETAQNKTDAAQRIDRSMA